MRNNIIKILQEKTLTIEDEIALEQLLETIVGDSDISYILDWLEKRRVQCKIKTEEIGIKELNKWEIDDKTGNIYHKSRKFFSIIGVKVGNANNREVDSWMQPMIKQQECGILGILCKKFNGVRKYLLYAKYEPGNMHKIQLSPTLQATKSNLELAHGGKKPHFVKYFDGRGKILTCVESVEDGGRFYLKTNKNIIVEVSESEDLDIPEDFIWVTLPQFKKLLKMDNIVNSLTRSIMSSWC